MKKIFIYSLSCPFTNEIKYIGKTNSLKRRLNSHIDYARKKDSKKRPVSDWILTILEKGKKPIINLLEEVDEINWSEKEQYWIAYFKSKKNPLLNITIGGKGKGSGIKYSDELKEIRRKARIGYKTPENTKEKIKKSLSKKVYCIDDDLIFESMNDAVIYSETPKTTFHRKMHKGEKINGKTYKYQTE